MNEDIAEAGAADEAAIGERAARAAIDALDALSARAFDASAYALVTGLYARAAALEAGATDAEGHLTARVAVRLRARATREAASLEARCVRARADAERVMNGLAPSLHARAVGALAAGDVTAVHRAARRRQRPRPEDPARDAREAAWLARLSAEVRATGAEHDPAGPVSATPRSRAIRELSSLLHARALDAATAAAAVARAADAVPSASGPYNALALATRALGELGALSPAYLRVQMARLEDLGALLSLPLDLAAARARPRRP